MTAVPWLRPVAEGVVLDLHIQPGAKRSGIVGPHGEALKIRLAAPPVDGKANECLRNFLAETLGVSKSQVALIAGETSRSKRVRIAGTTVASAAARLQPQEPS